MEISDCKNCGHSDNNLDIITTEGFYSGLVESVVNCSGCGMSGPIAIAEELDVPDKDFLIALAVKKWNKVNGNGH